MLFLVTVYKVAIYIYIYNKNVSDHWYMEDIYE